MIKSKQIPNLAYNNTALDYGDTEGLKSPSKHLPVQSQQ